MNRFFYLKLAFQNLKKNSKLVVPYVLTGILFTMMFYDIHALSTHSEFYGRERGMLLSLGVFVIAIFAVIFLFYTNSFLMKQRRSELGLYNILGMEKKHISRTLLYETMMMGSVSIVGGLILGSVFGQGMFLLLYKMINDLPQMSFEINRFSIYMTILLFGFIYGITAIYNISQIHLSKPIELLRSKSEGEKEPKTKWLMTLLGILCLGTGYYIAVSIKNPAEAMIFFFVAVVLVIIGTYLLFTAGTIAFLKMLRKNKKYYYKTSHFISVSNMIYRMKQNAVGLANICILSTMVLVMLSSTGSLVLGINDVVNMTAPYDLNFNFGAESKEMNEYMDTRIMESIDMSKVNETYHAYSFSIMADFEDNRFVLNESLDDNRLHEHYYVFVTTDNTIELADDEVAIVFSNGQKVDGLHIGERYYNAKQDISIQSFDSIFNYNPGFKSLVYVGLKDERSVDLFVEDMTHQNTMENPMHIITPSYNYGFNGDFSDEDLEKYDNLLQELIQDARDENIVMEGGYSYSSTFKKEARVAAMDLFGSFFFVGIFLSVLFVVATALIMYYKQMSEGHDDVKRYQILQKVGMDHSEVKKSIHSQIMIVFFMPLVTAGIHVMFAFNLIYQLFSAFGMSNAHLFASVTAFVFVIFSIFYFIIYQLTAKVYYKIVS